MECAKGRRWSRCGNTTFRGTSTGRSDPPLTLAVSCSRTDGERQSAFGPSRTSPRGAAKLQTVSQPATGIPLIIRVGGAELGLQRPLLERHVPDVRDHEEGDGNEQRREPAHCQSDPE